MQDWTGWGELSFLSKYIHKKWIGVAPGTPSRSIILNAPSKKKTAREKVYELAQTIQEKRIVRRRGVKQKRKRAHNAQLNRKRQEGIPTESDLFLIPGTAEVALGKGKGGARILTTKPKSSRSQAKRSFSEKFQGARGLNN